MDISSVYIKMCGNANDLQQLWTPTDFDVIIDNSIVNDDERLEIADKGDLHAVDIDYASPEDRSYQDDYTYYKNQNVWLPRQDQFLELLEPDASKAYLIMGKVISQAFHYPPKDASMPGPDIFKTMEQLGLAYFMKEKFGKIWGGKNWVSAP